MHKEISDNGRITLRINNILSKFIYFERKTNLVIKATKNNTILIKYIPYAGIPILAPIYEKGKLHNSIILITIWYILILPVAKIVTHNGPERVSIRAPNIIIWHISYA